MRGGNSCRASLWLNKEAKLAEVCPSVTFHMHLITQPELILHSPEEVGSHGDFGDFSILDNLFPFSSSLASLPLLRNP